MITREEPGEPWTVEDRLWNALSLAMSVALVAAMIYTARLFARSHSTMTADAEEAGRAATRAAFEEQERLHRERLFGGQTPGDDLV